MAHLHVHVPYQKIREYLSFINESRINIEMYFSSHTLDTIKESDIAELIGKFTFNPSFTIHGPFMDLSPGAVDEKVRAVTVQRFSRILEISEIIRPKVVVFHSGYEKWKYAHRVDIWLDSSLKTWPSLIKKAEATGAIIAIENIFEDEPDNLKLLMEKMGSEYFGICFDSGHFNLFSKKPLEDWLSALKSHIIELHLHDNNRTFDDHLAIGEGNFDFSSLFAELKNRELVYTIEAHSPEGVLKSMERLRKYVQ